MKIISSSLIAAACLAILTLSAQAGNIPVTNYSFESPGASFAVNNDPTVMTGWTVNSPSYYGEQSTGPSEFTSAQYAQGSSYLFMNLDGPGTASITSDNATTIADSTTYTLTVALGDHTEEGPYGDSGNMTISLLANGIVIPGASTTVLNGTITKGYFEDFSTSFSTAAVDPLAGEELSIQLSTSSGGQTQAAFDNVQLSVPEPSTYAMMLGGLALLGFCVRRKLA